MFIIVLPDGETFAALDGSLIAEVPDDLQGEEIEELLAADQEEQVALLKSYPQERLIFLKDGTRRGALPGAWRVAAVPIAEPRLPGEDDSERGGPICSELRDAQVRIRRATKLLAEFCGEGARSPAEERSGIIAELGELRAAHEQAERTYEAGYGRYLASAQRSPGPEGHSPDEAAGAVDLERPS